MAEPFAAGVLNSLLQPRVPQLGALARVARASSQNPGVSATFFTPAPRQGKQRASASASPAAVGQHILGCQAWACSSSKQELWGHDGSMRTTLMDEIAPTPTRGRVRRTSKSSRGRFHQARTPEPSRQYHVSSPHLAQPARDYSQTSTGVFLSPFPENAAPWSARAQQPNKKSTRNRFKELLNIPMSCTDVEVGIRFKALEESDYFREMPSYELLDFAHALAQNADSLCVEASSEDVYLWGQRLRYLIDLIETNASTSTSRPDQEELDALSARAQAFLGNISGAKEYIANRAASEGRRKVTSSKHFESSQFYHVFTSILMSLCVHESWEAAIDYFFVVSYPRWKQINQGTDKFFVDQRLGELLRFFQLDQSLQHISGWDSSKRKDLLALLLSALNGIGDLDRAHEYITSLRKMGLDCPPNLVAESVRGLMSRYDITRNENKAKELFRILPRDTPNYATLERLVKKLPPDKNFLTENVGVAQSLLAEARSVFGALPPAKTPSISVAKPIAEKPPIQAPTPTRSQEKPAPWSIAGFEKAYPKGPNGVRTPCPSLDMYVSLIHTLKAASDHRGGIDLWEDMKIQGVKPNIIFLSNVIACYRAVFDSKGALDVLKYMTKNGIKGDNIFYTMLIRHFVTRMDSTAAAAVYAHAVDSGVVPDLDTKLALLAAYLKGGEWKKGIALFTDLRNSGVKLSTATYNTVLEGCIFMGAPFKTVLRLFVSLEAEGVVPDKFTYSILMNHALVGGHWAFAQSLYQDLLNMDKESGRKTKFVDIALVTTMIRGFLRGGRQQEARDMIGEMRRLNIQHTAITHAAIARAYTMNKSEEDLALAEQYIQDVVSDPAGSWRTHDTQRMRKDPLSMMYAPLISARTTLGDVAGVERLMGQFFAAGGTPSISILRHLLKAYGEADQMENMRYVWARIVELALEPQTAPDAPVQAGMRSITAPLDIYTRILSQRGHHAELAQTWSALGDAGNAFDGDNWNSYAYACLRAGQVVRAFEVVERILQPAFNAGLRNHFSPPLPPTLPHAGKLAAIERLREGPAARPLVSETQRARAAHINRATNRRRPELVDAPAIAADFAYPLRALRKLGPGWHDWQPMPALLRAMLMAVLYLEDGLPVRALAPGETRAHDIAAEATEDRSVTEPLLRMLFEQHPRTAHRLSSFRYRERTTLGARGFRETYIWNRE